VLERDRERRRSGEVLGGVEVRANDAEKEGAGRAYRVCVVGADAARGGVLVGRGEGARDGGGERRDGGA
jgi:hypothetical protein